MNKNIRKYKIHRFDNQNKGKQGHEAQQEGRKKFAENEAQPEVRKKFGDHETRLEVRKKFGDHETRLEVRKKSAEREARSEVRKKFAEHDAQLERKKSPVITVSKSDKSVRNRCCLVRPKRQDFSQITESKFLERNSPPIEFLPKYEKQPAGLVLEYERPSPTKTHLSLLSEKYGFEPANVDSSIKPDYKSIMFGRSEIKNSIPHMEDLGVDAPAFVETSDGTQWQNIESINDLENFMHKQSKTKVPLNMPKNVHIEEIPKVKVIAEKFSKYQRDNVELRRLDEKVVCVEYDIFDKNSTRNLHKPVQAMRAFFSIKPLYEKDDTETLPLIALPSKIKNDFNIVEEDLNKLTQNGIEIIDENIAENKSYLEDLKRILKRTQFEQAKKDKSSLDLKYLYEMAKREWYIDHNHFPTNFLSLKELQEIKELILQKCASSVHGISRRMLKADSKLGSSGCLLAELVRDSAKKKCI